jgi:hypothetical protein
MEVWMEKPGIKILDKIDHFSPTLAGILEEIKNGENYSWSIFEIEGMLNPNQGYSIFELKEKINESEDGMFVNWNELILFSNIFFQIWEITVLRSADPKLLQSSMRKGSAEDECDFVLTFIDCAFWEIYSKNDEFLERLRKKFKKTELLELPGRE